MNIVEYIIRFKEQGFSKGISNAEAQVEKLDDKVKGFNSSISTGTVAAIAAAAVAVTAFVTSSVKAFNTQAQAEGQVRQGLISTEGQAGRTFGQLTKLASNLQKNTLFGDEEILAKSTAQLLTFTRITEERFDRTQRLALDLAQRLDGDLQGATISLGKALNDPVSNLKALTGAGVEFSIKQKNTIKSLQQTNKLADAQNIILDQLEKQYGGSAAAAAMAGSGGLQQLQNRLGDIHETIGGALLPIINVFANIIGGITGLIERNNETFVVVIQTIAVLVAILTSAIAVYRTWIVVQTIINVLMTANPIGIVIVAIAALVAGIIALYRNSETFRGIISGVFNVLKSVFNFLKALFIPVWERMRETFKRIGTSINDFLQKPIELAKAAFIGFLDLLEKIPGVGKLVKGLRESFSDGFKQGVEDFRKEQENTELGTNVGMGTGSPQPGDIPGAGSTSRPGTVSSSAPRQFNINIENLVREFQVVTNNITEGAEEIKAKITQALLEGVADVEIARK